jgi:hypothetical protein
MITSTFESTFFVMVLNISTYLKDIRAKYKFSILVNSLLFKIKQFISKQYVCHKYTVTI